VLERIGTEEAASLLRLIAAGVEGARLTQEARWALERLADRFDESRPEGERELSKKRGVLSPNATANPWHPVSSPPASRRQDVGLELDVRVSICLPRNAIHFGARDFKGR